MMLLMVPFLLSLNDQMSHRNCMKVKMNNFTTFGLLEVNVKITFIGRDLINYKECWFVFWVFFTMVLKFRPSQHNRTELLHTLSHFNTTNHVLSPLCVFSLYIFQNVLDWCVQENISFCCDVLSVGKKGLHFFY